MDKPKLFPPSYIVSWINKNNKPFKDGEKNAHSTRIISFFLKSNLEEKLKPLSCLLGGGVAEIECMRLSQTTDTLGMGLKRQEIGSLAHIKEVIVDKRGSYATRCSAIGFKKIFDILQRLACVWYRNDKDMNKECAFLFQNSEAQRYG